MSNSYIKQLDPMAGLVEYINDIKPYHTKIIENEVEYTNTDLSSVLMTESIVFEFSP